MEQESCERLPLQNRHRRGRYPEDRVEDHGERSEQRQRAERQRAMGISGGRGWRRRGNGTRARVTEPIPGVQDGGVVSALLIALLEAGEIDGALLAKPSEREPWKGVAHLARTPEEVIACAGSFYNQTLALGHLDLKKYHLPPKPAHRPGRHPLRDPGLAGACRRDPSIGAPRRSMP